MRKLECLSGWLLRRLLRQFLRFFFPRSQNSYVSSLVKARVCFLAILVKEMSKFGNSCRTQFFNNFDPENTKIWHVLSIKRQLRNF